MTAVPAVPSLRHIWRPGLQMETTTGIGRNPHLARNVSKLFDLHPHAARSVSATP